MVGGVSGSERVPNTVSKKERSASAVAGGRAICVRRTASERRAGAVRGVRRAGSGWARRPAGRGTGSGTRWANRSVPERSRAARRGPGSWAERGRDGARQGGAEWACLFEAARARAEGGGFGSSIQAWGPGWIAAARPRGGGGSVRNGGLRPGQMRNRPHRRATAVVRSRTRPRGGERRRMRRPDGDTASYMRAVLGYAVPARAPIRSPRLEKRLGPEPDGRRCPLREHQP